jgi:hypothetical protein
MMIRKTAMIVAAGLVLAALPAPAAAQPSQAQLQVSRITHNGPLVVGANTFRVTVRNSSQTSPAKGPVKVKLIVLDPQQKATEYEAVLRTGVGSNSDQTAAFPNVSLPKAGAYTLTAIADPDQQIRRYTTKTNERTEVFTVGEPATATHGQLLVIVKNEKGNRVSAARVSLKADGREIDWKRTGGTGEARFPKVAASPGHKPYVVEVRLGTAVHTFEYVMPGKDSLFEVTIR